MPDLTRARLEESVAAWETAHESEPIIRDARMNVDMVMHDHPALSATLREAVALLDDVYQDLGSMASVTASTYSRIERFRAAFEGRDGPTVEQSKEMMSWGGERGEP